MIIAANRDESYDRPTAPAHFWEDEPTILAGRDLLQMGTWLGITKQGRFAALTNYRGAKATKAGKISRGKIVSNFLASNATPPDYLEHLHQNKRKYEGFNVLLGNHERLYYYSNMEMKQRKLSSGTHGLSNHLLNTPWPKVSKGKQMLNHYVMGQKEINTDILLEILANNKQAQDQHLPHTGVGLELEKKLSPLFIKTPNYGTRSSSVLFVDNNNQLTFAERTYINGVFKNEKHFTFELET